MYSSIVSKKVFLAFALFVAVAASAKSAFAQVEQPSQISVQGTGLFTTSLKDQNPSYDATKSGGFLVGYSYQFNRHFGAEGNYGFSRNTQNYTALSGATSVQSDIHEATASLVWHIPTNIAHFRPYALGGGGALVFNPTDKFVVPGADQQTRAVARHHAKKFFLGWNAGGARCITERHSASLRSRHRSAACRKASTSRRRACRSPGADGTTRPAPAPRKR